MFDFGDELAIESYRVPWLIWIQIIVMLLLVLLLYCFSLFSLDLPHTSSSSSASSSLCPQDKKHVFDHSSKNKIKHVFDHDTKLVSTCFQASQVGENQSIKGEIAAGTSGRMVRGEDHSVEKEGISLKEVNQNCYHPCHYFRLAKLAFLKCLGLDSLFENSSSSEQRKQR